MIWGKIIVATLDKGLVKTLNQFSDEIKFEVINSVLSFNLALTSVYQFRRVSHSLIPYTAYSCFCNAIVVDFLA
jgi:hypothetical protein